MDNESRQCKWWAPCQYSKWDTTHTGEDLYGHPVKVQEKVCDICGKIRIRKEIASKD